MMDLQFDAIDRANTMDIDIEGNELNITRPTGEKKNFDLLQLTGAKGDKGDTGESTRIVSVSATVDAVSSAAPTVEVVTKGDKEMVVAMAFHGLKGTQGEKGEKGDRGEQGEKGAQGEKGEQGARGAAFTYADFTPEQISGLQKPATDAAAAVKASTADAIKDAKDETDKAVENANTATAEVNKYLGIVKLPVVEVAASGAAVAMDANKVYVISIGESLTVTLNAPTDYTIVNEWQGAFVTGGTAPTVTFPADVVWSETPSVEVNCYYEFNIRYVGGKYYGLIQSWKISSEG